MKRKRWTAKTEVTDALLKFREKRKWQIALRRYVLEQKWSASYAPYFGLDILRFRKWIELQFDADMTWDNFSEAWQFDHIIPVAYFDFGSDSDLRLCWNFINIRAAKLDPEANRPDVLAAKTYFDTLYTRTSHENCRLMVARINSIEAAQLENTGGLEAFIRENEGYLHTISSFSDYEYLQLNEGVEIDKILAERAFSGKIK